MHDPLKDPTFVWYKVKQFIGKVAKQKIRALKKLQSKKYDLLFTGRMTKIRESCPTQKNGGKLYI